MAIKFGRPINPSARLAPVGARTTSEPLDLAIRPRRNRRAEWARRMVRENVLTADDLIWPLFLVDGSQDPRAGRLHAWGRTALGRRGGARGRARDEARASPAWRCSPTPTRRCATQDGSEALNPDNLVCRAIRAIKKAVPDLGILCDVALDPYTSHGHDGLLRDGVILNDETVEVLAQQALVEAEAGCDIIAPSDMMDGRVGAIRDGARRRRASSTRRSWPTRRNTPRRSTVRSAMRSALPPRWWATSAPTRWTRGIPTRRCARPSSTSPRAPT